MKKPTLAAVTSTILLNKARLTVTYLSYKISPLQHVTHSVLKINSANITWGCVKRRGTENERQIITTVLTLTYLFFWNNDY